MIDISIIIVNYNVKEFVKNLLYSLHKALDNFSSEIIIIDNASSDGSASDIKEKFNYVNVIANKENTARFEIINAIAVVMIDFFSFSLIDFAIALTELNSKLNIIGINKSWLIVKTKLYFPNSLGPITRPI